MKLIDKILKEGLPKDTVVNAYLPEIKSCMERFGLEAWEHALSRDWFEYATENDFKEWLKEEI